MRDMLMVIGFLAAWIVLNRWILPWCGIQTCMGGACSRTPAVQTTNKQIDETHGLSSSKTTHRGERS